MSSKCKTELESLCTGDCSKCSGDELTVTLNLDDGTDLECAILTIFPVDGKDYIALLPLDENGQNNDGEVFIYRYSKDKNGLPSLDYIDDDDEYEAVSDAFDELVDQAEFDQIIAAEDAN